MAVDVSVSSLACFRTLRKVERLRLFRTRDTSSEEFSEIYQVLPSFCEIKGPLIKYARNIKAFFTPSPPGCVRIKSRPPFTNYKGRITLLLFHLVMEGPTLLLLVSISCSRLALLLQFLVTRPFEGFVELRHYK